MDRTIIESDPHELEASIARSTSQIDEVGQWEKTVFREQQHYLNQLTEDLDKEIRIQDQLQINIRKKLTQIAQLKAEIARQVPADNHAQITVNNT